MAERKIPKDTKKKQQKEEETIENWNTPPPQEKKKSPSTSNKSRKSVSRLACQPPFKAHRTPIHRLSPREFPFEHFNLLSPFHLPRGPLSCRLIFIKRLSPLFKSCVTIRNYEWPYFPGLSCVCPVVSDIRGIYYRCTNTVSEYG